MFTNFIPNINYYCLVYQEKYLEKILERQYGDEYQNIIKTFQSTINVIFI